MKRVLILLPALTLTLGACKKDYTCECTYNPGGNTDKYTIKNATKRQAKANCYSWSANVLGTIVKADCTLKK